MDFVKRKLPELPLILKDIGFDAINNIHYWRHNLRGNKVEKQYFTEDTSHPPVILIQGFLGTRGVLQPLEKFLRAQKRNVLSIDLGFFNVGDIRTSAEVLNYKIERILQKFGKEHSFNRVDIVGHSMGGLIGLYYLKKLGGHRVIRKLITLGAPFHGTWTSLLAVFPLGLVSKGLWQMVPASRFLKSLRKFPEASDDTEVISIAAKYDTICPPSSCHLEGATNYISNVGHAGLLLDERVFTAIAGFLDAKPSKSNIVHFTPQK